MSFGSFRKFILAKKKKSINFPTFCICRPNPCAYRPDFFSSSKNMKNLNPRLDFNLSQIFEFVSDFADFGVWWSWKSKLSKKAKKSRFLLLWTSDLLQKPFSPRKIFGPFLGCGAYSTAIWLEISIFQKNLKTQELMRIILQNGQNPPETRWSGLKWNLSVPRKNSTFSHISSTFSWKSAVKLQFACFLSLRHCKRA